MSISREIVLGATGGPDAKRKSCLDGGEIGTLGRAGHVFDCRQAGQPATAMTGGSRHPALPRENEVPWNKLKHLAVRIDG